MKASRAFAVTKRVLRDLKNDRRQLALIFIAPLLVISLFGVAFTGNVKDVRVVVVNSDTAVGNSCFAILLFDGRTRGPDEIRAPRRRRPEGRRIVYQAEKLSVDGVSFYPSLNRDTRTRVMRYNTVLILVNEDGHP